MNKKLLVPIALIESAWSGTPVEFWEPQDVIDSNPVMEEAAIKIKNASYRPTKPGLIYNAMIYPISNYTIAGAIWYQGEGNTSRTYAYEKMFTGMIGQWRKQFEQDFPFYYVQIAPYASYQTPYEAVLLMEQQTLSLSYPKTRMVVITDLVDNIKSQHPLDKLDAGLRLANIALAETYKKDIPVAYKNPMYKKMEVHKGKINLYFDNAPNGFIIKGEDKLPTEFFIAGAGEDKNFLSAEVKLEKNRIVVWNKQIPNPVAVKIFIHQFSHVKCI